LVKLLKLSRQTLFLIGGIAMMFVTNPRLTLTTLAVLYLTPGSVQ